MNKIKHVRNLLGITIRELSEKSDVAISYISTLENDKNDLSNPSKDVMERIAKALNSSVPEIFFEINDEKESE
ncbi:MAG: helix-turn-helix domain-containing protein [Clostridium sp.]|nr:helix-turn-helix domain-containing protein [Clostridium sp.]